MQNLKTELQNWIGPKVLMTIYPHPDDETMMAGGLLLTAKQLGWQTIVVTLTRGGAGQIHIPIGEQTLPEVRTHELENAVKLLQVDKLELGHFDDAKLREEQPQWESWVNEMIAKYKPGWIVTYDPSGLTGHPDHIALGVYLQHAPAKVWWTSAPRNFKFVDARVKDTVTPVTHKLDIGGKWFTKYRAACEHRTQALGNGLPIPLWLALLIFQVEWYHEVDSAHTYPFHFIDFKI